MSRRKSPASTAREQLPAVQPHVIHADAVYDLATARAALGLKVSTIRTAWKKQGLKISRRAGRVYILGRWLLDWLEPQVGPGAAPDFG
jgi:hypothetical protein